MIDQSMKLDISRIVDLSRYPIDRLDSDQGKQLISECRQHLADDGSCTLDDFLLKDALEQMTAEAETLIELAYPGPTTVSPYFFNYRLGQHLDVDDSHPVHHKGRRNLCQVAADLIPKDHLLRVLYHSSEMIDFLSLVQKKSVFQFKDKYQSLNISVMQAGGCQQWHFDSGQMVTTMLLQEPEQGGIFEYVPNIRSEEDEHFNEVKKVLDNKSDRVKQLQLKRGMLSLFKGHYSIHRVTEVTGGRLRLQAILAYVHDADRVGNIHSSISNYGPRVAELESGKP